MITIGFNVTGMDILIANNYNSSMTYQVNNEIDNRHGNHNNNWRNRNVI